MSKCKPLKPSKMTFSEIQELIKLIGKSNLAEFKLKEKDFEIQIKTDKFTKETSKVNPGPQVVSYAPASPVTNMPVATPTEVKSGGNASDSAKEVSSGKTLVEIKSPIVGTFYRSPGPDKPPFIKIGDTVKSGDTVCIIEAMKLFNEIESDASGVVVKVLVEDASPVEYDQVLFLVEV